MCSVLVLETRGSLLELLTELEETACGRRFYLLEGFRYLLEGLSWRTGDQIRCATFFTIFNTLVRKTIGVLSGRLDEGSVKNGL